VLTGAGFAGWGRFALGGTFEDHVADVLGLDPGLARELLDRVREGVDLDYDVHASAFLLATTRPSRWLMPTGARHKAIESFLKPIFSPSDNPAVALAYVGLRRTSVFTPCNVLVRDA
jgi:hypothetical protein